MKTDQEIADLAFELFFEVHARLGHGRHESWLSREVFLSEESWNVDRRRMWLEVARVLDERFVASSRWLDEYAFELFLKVHGRLGHKTLLSREVFDSLSPRRRAWCEIAKIFDERLNASR